MFTSQSKKVKRKYINFLAIQFLFVREREVKKVLHLMWLTQMWCIWLKRNDILLSGQHFGGGLAWS